jgi:hypothetical protein
MLKRRNVILAIAIGIGCTGGIMASGTTTASAHCDGVNDADGDNIPVDGQECAGSTSTAVVVTTVPPTTTTTAFCATDPINFRMNGPCPPPFVPGPTTVPPAVEIGTAIAVTPPKLSLTPAVSVAPVLPTVVTVVPLPTRPVVLPATL